ncbi:MAG: hypothetical protein K0R57_562 [Paenibacillaceae bacterium]|nr:hypothetical protein [Paenibacillaceae bacterium]
MVEDDKEELTKRVNNDDQELRIDFVWCLVGNIINERFYGAEKEIKRGTKKFSPGSKVYCFPALWGDGYEEIKVIGKTRKRKNYSVLITSSKYITNWRIQKAFTPFIVKTMIENQGWDGTEQSKELIEIMLNRLPSVTMRVRGNPDK